MADTPEASEFTSIYERIRDYADCETNNGTEVSSGLVDFQDRAEQKDKTIPFDFEEYLKLIDWSGRAIFEHKRGAIPAHYPCILLKTGYQG